MTRYFVHTVLLVLTISLVCTTPVRAEIITDGSFESPDVPNTGFTDADPFGWIVSESESLQITIFDRPDLPAVDGDQFLAFNGGGT